ncbi:MAG: hypothetical protein HKP61_11275 [Dactylosporangium sp.]|nr:hypothetical protein [Dactylosporangium sp.]NNJ61507.1 hypothetical protein [Dactylosporangium sp.]
MYSTDRDAATAWRALPAQTRWWCREGPFRREPLRDVQLASIVAGYGETMTRRMRWLFWLSAAGLLALDRTQMVVSALSARAAHASELPVGLAILCCLVVALLQAVPHLRYRRLRNWGLLAVEKVQIAAVPAAADAPGAPGQAPATEIRVRRRFLAHVAAGCGAAALVVFGDAGHELVTAGSLPAVWLIGLVLSTVLVVLVLWEIRSRTSPAVIRLTSDGWALPGSGLCGTWAEVREIEVRAGRALGWPRFALAPHTDVRFVVLRVADPQRHINAVRPAHRRWDARADCRLYGSPVVIPASRRYTASVVDVVQTLRRFTPAPVSWL